MAPGSDCTEHATEEEMRIFWTAYNVVRLKILGHLVFDDTIHKKRKSEAALE